MPTLQCSTHGWQCPTVSARNADLVKQLGANDVVDTRSSRFEDLAEKVDIVFDTVDGETLAHSWEVLKPGGRMVTIFSRYGERAEKRVKDAFFIVKLSRQELINVRGLLDA
jgi:NADPH:quinone reductase-like Zn-dependent oxidoreductase